MLENLGINIFNLFIFLSVALIGLPLLGGFISYYLAKNLKSYMVDNFSFKSQYWIGGLGVIIHELGHAVFALIFLHRITKIKLLNFHPEDGTLGSVENSYNPHNWYQTLGSFFIGLAPLFMGLFVFWLLIKFLCHPVYSMLPLHQISQLNVTNFLSLLSKLTTTWLGNIISAFLSAGIVHQLILIVLIGIISSTVFSLSEQDLHSSYTGLPSYFIIVFVLSLICGLLETFNFSFLLFFEKFIMIIAALWLVLLILIFICMIISLIEMWFMRLILNFR
ncbi:hypothetical protein ACQW5G_05450 [Fructilactobacillus sp. Tb1]|uniref:hypothetical protein n=1 Tax=Fructilactobacillus sp. Tb1 TaxID=3422304 RepID=UPI003D297DE8